jgi:hypothetical protein
VLRLAWLFAAHSTNAAEADRVTLSLEEREWLTQHDYARRCFDQLGTAIPHPRLSEGEETFRFAAVVGCKKMVLVRKHITVCSGFDLTAPDRDVSLEEDQPA